MEGKADSGILGMSVQDEVQGKVNGNQYIKEVRAHKFGRAISLDIDVT